MNIRPIALLVGATISSQAFALDEPIVITATRTAQTVDQNLASVTIITREDIATSQAQSINELITGHLGIDTTNRGGYGKTSSLFIRGTGTGHVLVLVDGMQIGSATTGQAELSQIPVDQIERIEIVRGPRSSLYGSEAIGGVIHIFTRQGVSGYQTHIEMTRGSNNFQKATVATSGSYGNSRYTLSLTKLSDGGFDAIDDGETDDDGYENQSFSARIGHTFKNGLDIDLHTLKADSESDFDGSSQNESETVLQNYGLKASLPINDNWYSKLSIANSKDDSDAFLNGVYSSTFTTERQQVSWQNDLKLSPNYTLTAGVDQRKDKVEGFSWGTDVAYTEDQRTNTGIFTQLMGEAGAHSYQASLRQDDYDNYNSQNTGALAWGYTLSDATRLMTSYGTAFKAPSFNDLYYPWSGNPDLKPEESRSIEIGIRHKTEVGSVEVNAYQTKIKNLIEWQQDINGTWAPVNVTPKIKGVEISYIAQVAGWNTTTELSWLDPRDTGSDKLLQLRAQKSARIELSRDFGKASLAINFIAQSMRYADAINSSELGGYGIVNISSSYALTKQWRLNGRIQNLADKEYETVQNYNTAGRTFFVSIAYDMTH